MILRVLAVGAGEMPPRYEPPAHGQLRALRSVMHAAIGAELVDLGTEIADAKTAWREWGSIDTPAGLVEQVLRLRSPPDAGRRLAARVERLHIAAVAWGALHPLEGDDGPPPDETCEGAAWALVALARGDQDRVRRWYAEALRRSAIRAL